MHLLHDLMKYEYSYALMEEGVYCGLCGTDGVEVSHAAGPRRQVPQDDVAVVAGAEEHVGIDGVVF